MDETRATAAPGGGVMVRRARVDDAEPMRALRLRALAESPAAFGSTLERELAFGTEVWLERTSRAATAPDTATFLAERAGLLVGMCGGCVDPKHDATCYLFGLWVAPEVRRLHVASALVAAVEAWAVSVGMARVRLHVVESNVEALALYGRRGYRETGVRQPVREGSDASEVELDRTLSPA